MTIMRNGQSGNIFQTLAGLSATGMGCTDREAATKTITAAAEASGLGNADYNVNRIFSTFPAQLTVLCMVGRNVITIDSLNAGCASVRCRVYMDAQDANHLLFDLTYAVAGQKIEIQNLNATTMPTFFNLFKAGGAHVFYWFFWVDAGNAVISEALGAWGIGSSGANLASPGKTFCYVSHFGWVSFNYKWLRQGTGTFSALVTKVASITDLQDYLMCDVTETDSNSAASNFAQSPNFVSSLIGFGASLPTVATDAILCSALDITLESQQ